MNHELVSIDTFINKHTGYHEPTYPFVVNVLRGVDFKSVVSAICTISHNEINNTVVLATDEFTMNYCEANNVKYIDFMKDYVSISDVSNTNVVSGGNNIRRCKKIEMTILFDKLNNDTINYDILILSSINVMSKELLSDFLMFMGMRKKVALVGDSYIPDFMNSDGYITNILNTSAYRIAGPLNNINSLVKMTSRDIVMFSNRIYMHQINLAEHVLYKKTNSIEVLFNEGDDTILHTNFSQPNDTGLIIIDNDRDLVKYTELYRTNKLGKFDNTPVVNDILMSYDIKYYNDKNTGERVIIDVGTRMIINKIEPVQYGVNIVEVTFNRNNKQYTVDIEINLEYITSIMNRDHDRSEHLRNNIWSNDCLNVFYGYVSGIKHVLGKSSDIGIVLHDFNVWGGDRRMLYTKLIPIQKQLKVVLKQNGGDI